MTLSAIPTLDSLPKMLPIDNAVRLELQEGMPMFRATDAVQSRIEALLYKRQEVSLSQSDEKELNSYEEIDDYLSFVNRTMRNLLASKTQRTS